MPGIKSLFCFCLFVVFDFVCLFFFFVWLGFLRKRFIIRVFNNETLGPSLNPNVPDLIFSVKNTFLRVCNICQTFRPRHQKHYQRWPKMECWGNCFILNKLFKSQVLVARFNVKSKGPQNNGQNHNMDQHRLWSLSPMWWTLAL